MAKKIVSLEELSAWFTERVRKATGVDDASVTLQYTLVTPDQYGKLWSDSVVFNSGSAPLKEVLAAVHDAYQEALDSFDVPPKV